MPASGQGAGDGCVGVGFPTHKPLGSINEKRGVPAHAVAEDNPQAAQRLWVDESHHDLAPMALLNGPHPRAHPQVLGLDLLRILVDLLGMNLLADPRSLQERLTVGSVVEAGEHRGNHIHDDRLHVPLPQQPRAGRIPARGFLRYTPADSRKEISVRPGPWRA